MNNFLDHDNIVTSFSSGNKASLERVDQIAEEGF